MIQTVDPHKVHLKRPQAGPQKKRRRFMRQFAWVPAWLNGMVKASALCGFAWA
jgi:hypothetical protein